MLVGKSCSMGFNCNSEFEEELFGTIKIPMNALISGKKIIPFRKKANQ